MEDAIISGVTHDTSQSRITISDVPDRPGTAARIFTACAAVGVNVDMILQTPAVNDVTDVAFTVPSDEIDQLRTPLDNIAQEVGAPGWRIDDEVGLVSLVGAGMKTHPGIAARMFSTLADEGINIQMISTSPIKISCVIPATQVDDAVRSLHQAFDLAEAAVGREHA
jgi:aspartate kinase